MNNSIIELTNLEILEYCLFNLETYEKEYSKKSNQSGFRGLYFRDNNTFFALYPSVNGPAIFYNEKEFLINKTLTITLKKDGKNRRFTISEFQIEIDYIESPFIGLDTWSDEIDVDLFYKITQMYKEDSFYSQYTLIERQE